jgi:hypothetical protein
MAISISSTKKTTFGNKKVVFLVGTFANGDTSGTADSGLKAVDFAIAAYTDALAKIMNVSASGGTLTITTQDPGATKTFNVMVVGH